MVASNSLSILLQTHHPTPHFIQKLFDNPAGTLSVPSTNLTNLLTLTKFHLKGRAIYTSN